MSDRNLSALHLPWGKHRETVSSSEESALVVGLGRFGLATARRLAALGVEVMGIDSDPVLVQRVSHDLDNLAVVDATDSDALEQLGLDHVTVAIVAIANVEASVVSVLKLKEAGIPEVWAKAASRTHGEILERVGANHVVYPEAAAGMRVAHSVAHHLFDYFEFEDGFAVARVLAPSCTWDRTLGESAVRQRYQVTVVGVKRQGEPFSYAIPETTIREGDQLIVSGSKQDVDRFSRLR
ncbi:TrkA family potassium uptake protein [Luteococcus sediminum]